MMDLNELYHMINQQRTIAKISNVFPFDGSKSVQTAISHPASIELWAYMNSKLSKEDISKAMLTFCQQLIKMSQSEDEKSVCAKIVHHNDTIVECFDCRADPSCIICLDCFKNGNHKGHRVIFKKAGGGCCDCGDPEAWKQEGFCSKHTGKVKEVSILPEQSKFSNHLLLELFYIYSWYKINGSPQEKKFQSALLSLLTKIMNQGLKGMKLISLFLSQEPPKCLTVSSQLSEAPLEQIFNSRFINREQFNHWEKLFIEMFPYYPFKQQLLAKYVKCFESLYARNESKGQSIACQIVTSYKLVQDYSDSIDAIPIIVSENKKVSEAYHLTKMLTYDLNRINSLQGEAPFKYWRLIINHGIECLFGYYQSLKSLARKEKEGAQQSQKTAKKRQKKSPKTPINEEGQSEDEDKNFSLVDFLFRHNTIVEVQYSILQEFLSILPELSKHEDLMLKVIKSLFLLIVKDIKKNDDLLIYRPYERMLGLALFFYARQTPFILSNPKLRETIREAIGINQTLWEQYLSIIQQRMLETFGFFSHMQTCETYGYNTTFYIYLVLYSSKYNLFGHVDILILKQIIFLGAPEMVIDFAKIAKIDRLEPQNKWTFRSFLSLVSEIGLLYTGSFSEIYVSYYPQKSNPPAWLEDEAKRAIKKFITAEGGSASFQRINQFSNSFLFKDEDDIKIYLKQLCTFNKERKLFELLPANYDRNPLNFKDFLLRTKLQNSTKEIMHPNMTLQYIDKQNINLFTYVWNKKNIESLCQILLAIHDEVQQNKNIEQMAEYFSIPCRIEYFLKAADVLTNLYAPLSELLFTFQVPSEVRKQLGVLSQCLSPVLEEQSNSNEDINEKKQQMRLKKMKKLEEWKKKTNDNMIKIKEKHQIQEIQEEMSTDHCSICKKSGGNLVWVAKMLIRNLEKIANLGPGTLTMSFTSCYHAFHYECISKNSINRSTHDFLFRCPVCRSLGNVFFSISSKQNLDQNTTVQASFDRIMHVAMTMRSYTSFDIYQQIFKSFYHFVLLGYLLPDYTRQKRMKLYKQILNILCYKKIRGDLQALLKKLQNNEIVLQPKMTAIKQQINLQQVEVEEEDYFDEEDDEYIDSDEDFDIRLEMGLNIEAQEGEMNEEGEKEEKEEKVKPKREIGEAKKKKKKKYQPSPLFVYTIRRIIIHILKAIDQGDSKMTPEEDLSSPLNNSDIKQVQKEEIVPEVTEKFVMKQEKEQKNKGLEPEAWTVTLLDELLDENIQKDPVQWKAHQQVRVINLPQTFYWDLTDSSCDECGKMCPDLMICLLCGWKGCLNTCKKNGIKNHNKKKHGESGAFLRLKDANAYMIGPGELTKIGCLYVNEWGQDFDQKEDWNCYKLQTSVFKKIGEMILKNE